MQGITKEGLCLFSESFNPRGVDIYNSLLSPWTKEHEKSVLYWPSASRRKEKTSE